MAYIERSFPLKHLGPTIKSAANSKADVYQMHRWWARRPGPQVRSILQLMFWDGQFNESTYTPIDHYINYNDLKGKVILDPFMGGGSTIVEGMKLNAKMIGVDVNPVAWFVTKKETDWIDPKIVEAEFERIKEDVGNHLLSLYKTQCPHCQQEADIMYIFWAKIGKCENCGTSQPLFNNYVLTKFKEAGEQGHYIYCPKCKAVYFTTQDPSTATCPECGHEYDATEGNNSRGKCICESCGFKNKTMDAVKNHSVPPEHVMYALEYYCPHCESKAFKKIGQQELDSYAESLDIFEGLSEEHTALIPEQKVPLGDKTKELTNYGYYYFMDMFNKRQLYCAVVLYKRILEIEDQNLREFFILIHNQALDSYNEFCHFDSSSAGIKGVFSKHAFPPKINPIENNYFGVKYGTGTFRNYVKKILGGMNTESYKQIRYMDLKKAKPDKIMPDFIKGKENTIKPFLICTSGEDLYQIQNKSVDAIFTDPPYYDNVMYSELSDFYYVWLKKALEREYPKEFSNAYSPKTTEIVVNKTRKVGKAQFTKMLTNVFKETNRVLKDDGLAVVIYNHKSTDGWSAIIKTLLDASFEVKAVYPMLAESTGSLHRASGNIKYNMTIVLRKRLEETTPISWRIVEQEVFDSVKKQIIELNEQGLSETDISVIVMGKALEIFSKYYPKMVDNDQFIDVDEGLELLRAIVDYSNNEYLSQLIPEGIDKFDEFYLRHLYGRKEIGSDELNLFLRTANLPVDDLMKRELIQNASKGRREYLVLDFDQRAKILNHNSTVLDKVQYLARLFTEDKSIDKALREFEPDEIGKAVDLCAFFENRAPSKKIIELFAYCKEKIENVGKTQQKMF
jgi:adenine-specific DNA methylase